MGSIPGWETKISYASGLKKNKNRSNILTNSIKTLKYSFFKLSGIHLKTKDLITYKTILKFFSLCIVSDESVFISDFVSSDT